MRDYLRVYKDGTGITIGPLMDAALKKHKSHHRIWICEDNIIFVTSRVLQRIFARILRTKYFTNLVLFYQFCTFRDLECSNYVASYNSIMAIKP